MKAILLLITLAGLLAGCDPMPKPTPGSGAPPVAQEGPKIVPNHIGSPEWKKAHPFPPDPKDPKAVPKAIPVQPDSDAKFQPIPVKPDPGVKGHAVDPLLIPPTAQPH